MRMVAGKRHIAVIFAIVAVFLLNSACTPNARIIESGKTPEPTPAAERPQKDGFEADVEAMRTADFQYIFVFRRKDGAELDNEDKKFINSQKPLEVNRVRLSDNGRAVIFGSNFRLPPELMKNLIERYDFEDLSLPAGPETPPGAAANQTR